MRMVAKTGNFLFVVLPYIHVKQTNTPGRKARRHARRWAPEGNHERGWHHNR